MRVGGAPEPCAWASYLQPLLKGLSKGALGRVGGIAIRHALPNQEPNQRIELCLIADLEFSDNLRRFLSRRPLTYWLRASSAIPATKQRPDGGVAAQPARAPSSAAIPRTRSHCRAHPPGTQSGRGTLGRSAWPGSAPHLGRRVRPGLSLYTRREQSQSVIHIRVSLQASGLALPAPNLDHDPNTVEVYHSTTASQHAHHLTAGCLRKGFAI